MESAKPIRFLHSLQVQKGRRERTVKLPKVGFSLDFWYLKIVLFKISTRATSRNPAKVGEWVYTGGWVALKILGICRRGAGLD